MPKHQYVPTGALFEDDNESDEESTGFRSRIPCPQPKKTQMNCIATEQQQHFAHKIQNINQRTLESAKRSLNLLEETKEVGIHTGRELVSQGEKLERTNMMLDQIDSHLKQSQKDINGIKSVFYSLKKAISGKSRSPSPSNCHVSPHKKPAKKAKSTFYGTQDHSLQGTTKMSDFEAPCTSLHSLDAESSAEPLGSKNVDNILEAHLEGISNHLAQLKVIGAELGTEINYQNELLDTLEDKVEHADIKIGKQNNEMNKILGN